MNKPFASKSEEKRVTAQQAAPEPIKGGPIYVEQLMEDSARIEIDHGFPTDSFGDFIAHVHGEMSEAWEEKRDGRADDEIYYRQGDRKPEGIPVELADAIIRIAAWSKRHGVPLDRAIKEKQAFNEGRPYLHGRKF